MSLATNWRESTGVFVCQRSGDDATGDGSQSAPYKTLQHSGNLNLRAGYYSGQSLANGKIEGDGFVVWDASGEIISFPNQSGNRGSVVNLYLKNHNDFNGSTNQFNMSPLKSCIIENCTLNDKNRGLEFCILKDSTDNFTSKSLDFRVTSINSLSSNSNKQNCFYSQASNVQINSRTLTDCAFESGATINSVDLLTVTLDSDADTIGNTYVSNERFSGTATIGGNSVTFTNCFWTADPKFNDPANDDYTLQPDSPLINNLNIIGCYSVATPFDSNHTAFDPANSGVSYVDVTRNTGDGSFDLTAPAVAGTVTSTDDPTLCLTLPFATNIREAVQWFGTFLYNQGEWIDKENYDPGINDEVRLTLEVQVYDENEPNGADSSLNFSDWIDMEVQMPFEVDASQRGNGNVNADMPNLASIVAKRFRVRFTIRTNGV